MQGASATGILCLQRQFAQWTHTQQTHLLMLPSVGMDMMAGLEPIGNMCNRGQRLIFEPETDDVIKRFGIGERRASLTRHRAWRCDACGELTRTAEPAKPPSPCKRCENIIFLVVHDA